MLLWSLDLFSLFCTIEILRSTNDRKVRQTVRRIIILSLERKLVNKNTIE